MFKWFRKRAEHQRRPTILQFAVALWYDMVMVTTDDSGSAANTRAPYDTCTSNRIHARHAVLTAMLDAWMRCVGVLCVFVCCVCL